MAKVHKLTEHEVKFDRLLEAVARLEDALDSENSREIESCAIDVVDKASKFEGYEAYRDSSEEDEDETHEQRAIRRKESDDDEEDGGHKKLLS